MRDSVLAALIPIGLGILVATLLLLPRILLTSFNMWILVELYLGLAFLDFYYLTKRYKVGRQTIFSFAALTGAILIVLSYVPYEVQILAYIATGIASLLMYFRVIVAFRRRKYA